MNTIKNIFYSKKESWWFISFSMFLSSGILIEPQLLAAAIGKNDLTEMWVYWSSLIGVGFSIAFFSHLWAKTPIKTENEFILFRFSGRGSKILHAFRSLYLGGLIIPFLIAFNILAFSKIIEIYTDYTKINILTLLVFFLVIGTFFNKFYLRIKIDFYLLLLFIILFFGLIVVLIYNIGGVNVYLEAINTTAKGLTIIPQKDSVSFSNFLVFVLIQWWSASILDYPDMNGQKLLASKSIKDTTKSVLFPSLLLIFFKIILLSFAFIQIKNHQGKNYDSEFAFAHIFLEVLPNWILPIVLVFFGISFLSIIQNLQNWSGALLTENFYKTYINNQADKKQTHQIGIIAMIYVLLAAGLISFYANSIMGMVKFLFTITAGVGPVFILRWYWWRVNAWSQFSAMISAMIIPILYDYLFENSVSIRHFFEAISHQFNVDQYPIKIVVLTIIVSLIWISVTYLTKPTDEIKIKKFIKAVQPEGWWKVKENTNSVFLYKRVFIWVLLTINSLISITLLWNFVQLKFYYCLLLFVLYVFLFYIAYKRLNAINKS